MSNIKEIIRQLAKGSQTVNLVCTVDAVNKTARTVDCTPLDESAPLLGVNLQANQGSKFGIVAFPRVGSFVVVGFVADGNAGVVLLTDEVESIEWVFGENSTQMSVDGQGLRISVKGKSENVGGTDTVMELTSEGIVLNGGGLGGIVKVEQLTRHINAIENDINTLKKVFSAWKITPNDGGAALKLAATTWAGSPLTLTRRGDYENEKVKHG